MENGCGIGTVTQAMVQQRASELAMINGRAPQHIWLSDLEQAHQELTGAGNMETETEIEIPTDSEATAWNPVPGSPGHQVPEANTQEHDEWQEDSLRLIEEGLAEAENDQMVRARQQEPSESQK